MTGLYAKWGLWQPMFSPLTCFGAMDWVGFLSWGCLNVCRSIIAVFFQWSSAKRRYQNSRFIYVFMTSSIFLLCGFNFIFSTCSYAVFRDPPRFRRLSQLTFYLIRFDSSAFEIHLQSSLSILKFFSFTLHQCRINFQAFNRFMSKIFSASLK